MIPAKGVKSRGKNRKQFITAPVKLASQFIYFLSNAKVPHRHTTILYLSLYLYMGRMCGAWPASWLAVRLTRLPSSIEML